ncbi:MAG: GntR family transcriptional regulator [Verrucomicrobiota bacterium]
MITDHKLLRQEISDKLSAHIRKERLWGKRLPSQRMLSKQLGVSLVTVNKAVELLKREGLLVGIPGHGTCVVDQASVRLSSGSRGLMAIVSHKASDPRISPYFQDLLAPLMRYSCETGMDTLFASLHTTRGADSLLRNPPDAIRCLVFLSTSEGAADVCRIMRWYKRRAVMIDHYIKDSGATGIMDNGVEGMKALAGHLFELGHGRIAFLDMSRADLNPWKRNGYCAAHRDRGLRVDPDLIVNTSSAMDSVEAALTALLRLPDPPTAILCCDDDRAVKAMAVLRRLGLGVGTDVSVAGYGDLAAAEHDLTSVRYDRQALGELAVQYFSDKLDIEDGSLVTVDVDLRARSSTGRARLGQRFCQHELVAIEEGEMQ